MAFSFIDFYIGYQGHPNFRDLELIEDDLVRVIVQKYEMVIFTNKGELFGDPNFGAGLTELLHETRISSEAVEADIRAQIADYIPELEGIDYELTIEFVEDPENFQEVMLVNFTVAGYQVYASVI